MPLYIPLPESSVFDDFVPYIPLLLSAVEGFLELPDVWGEADWEAARLYMEDLKWWLMELEFALSQVKVSSLDTTAGYLEDKLLAGDNITLTKNNAGANESLTVASNPALRTQILSITYLTPSPQLIATLPTGALLKDVTLTIDAPFDGDYIAQIGVPGNVGLFMAAADNYPATPGAYATSPDYRCLDVTEVYLYTTHSGATAGTGHITLVVEE